MTLHDPKQSDSWEVSLFTVIIRTSDILTYLGYVYSVQKKKQVEIWGNCFWSFMVSWRKDYTLIKNCTAVIPTLSLSLPQNLGQRSWPLFYVTHTALQARNLRHILDISFPAPLTYHNVLFCLLNYSWSHPLSVISSIPLFIQAIIVSAELLW